MRGAVAIVTGGGTGIGAGIILHRKIYHGRTGSAAEGGHVTIDYRGPRCNCGKFGCIEALASGPAIARLAQSKLAGGRSSRILELAGEQDAIRATAWIDEAVQGGAKLLTGGKRKGALVEPAVLTGTTPEMRVNCAEVFAPVVTVEPYEDFREAVRQVNDSSYGLQAGVLTRDAGLIQLAFEELEVGGVIVGDVPSFRIDQMPYGGIKESGNTKEGPAWAVREMTEERLVVIQR